MLSEIQPLPLKVALTRSERAGRAAFAAGGDGQKSPDPEGRIHRDREDLLDLETAVVPAVGKGKGVYRLHVRMRPTAARKAAAKPF